jgi:hypothetical protein
MMRHHPGVFLYIIGVWAAFVLGVIIFTALLRFWKR